MLDKRNTKLQELCRSYLSRLGCLAKKHGLSTWLNNTIQENARGECSSTEEEVEMLSRMVDDERLSRVDVPKLLGKTYRQSNEDGDFEKIKKLHHVGIYSKVNTLLFKSNIDKDGNKQKQI